MLHKLIQVSIGSPLGVLLLKEDLWVQQAIAQDICASLRWQYGGKEGQGTHSLENVVMHLKVPEFIECLHVQLKVLLRRQQGGSELPQHCS